MADTQKTRKAFVISGFNDAGTGREFKKGATVDVTEGEFANYAAAGLVREPGADDKAAAKAA
ncbi:hypothetical protein [Sphingomonas sp.]|uniref:hypothetical protein n=1 Tax=Sphingomonas sp. TaxID=28214 RepID=UPI003B006F7D